MSIDYKDYETEPTDGEKAEARAIGEAKRASELDALYDRYSKRFGNWEDTAKQANTFMRGTHFGDNYGIRGDNRTDDYMPEDRNYGEEKKIPSMDYSLSRIDRLVQFCRSDEGVPTVESEGAYSLELVSDDAIEEVGARFGELPQNEAVAKLATARLDKFRDHSDINRVLDDICMTAAMQRMAFTVGEWVEDETEQEPFKLRQVKVGDFWFDPDGNDVASCKFIGYKRTKQERKVVEKKYDKDLSQYNDQKYIDVEHHYTRDFSIEHKNLPTGEIGEDGEEIVETGTIYKYPRGWRYTVKFKNTILYDGPMTTAGSLPPIRTMPWRKLPFSMIGVSAWDSTASINRAVDKLIDVISKSAYRMLPKIFVNSSEIANAEELDEGEAAGYVDVDGDVGDNALRYIQGGAVPVAAYELMNNLMAMGDQMCGAEGINMENASKFEMSGDAIEGIVQDQEGIAGKLRDSWHEYLKDVYTMAMRFYMANETEDVSVSLDTPNGKVDVIVNMSRYQFDDSEFETRFDVQVFSPKNMPRNPVRKAQYIQETFMGVYNMMQADPNLARMYVQNTTLPNSGELLSYINEIANTPPPEMAADTTAQDEAAAKVAMTEQEARIRMAADAAKSVGDSMEKAANKAADLEDFNAAREITTAIPAAVNTAYDEVMMGGQPPVPDVPIPDQPVEIQ